MKKLLAAMLALSIGLLAPVGALGESVEASALTVGSVTEMSGSFYSGLWGNNTSDMDVRGLLHGYATVAWQRAGNYAVNQTALEDVVTELAPNGDKTYRFTLNQNLKWNNGQPVTAMDYVFTVLLQSSPEIAALGVSNASFSHLSGWEAFSVNSGAPFSGVRLFGEHSFSLTVRGEVLPYFYELMYVNVEPTPIQTVAPGVTVVDTGAGAYFAPQGDASADFTEELIRATLLGEDGYVRNPRVTCGPYNLSAYDGAAHTAAFEKNPYFLGNDEGRIPEIERLFFRSVSGETMLDDLESGRVDILNKVVDGKAVTRGLDMVGRDMARSVSYARSGFAFLSFACEDETMSQLSVRKALAMCVDTAALCETALSGYALPVYGYYGLGQWMVSQGDERLSGLNRYGYDPVGAKALLEDDGWLYNESGRLFAEGTDDMRYKMQDGRMIPLEIRWALSPESTAAENLKRQLEKAAETLGARLSVTELSFEDLLSRYYRQTERTYNLFLLGTNFSHVFDPYYAFHTGDEYQGVYNTTGLRDGELMKRAEALRGVEGGDTGDYLERWFAFQQRWVEVLPMIPLYGNVYFDFTRPDLYGYQINTHWGWSSAILYAAFTAPEEPVAGMETVADGEQAVAITD